MPLVKVETEPEVGYWHRWIERRPVQMLVLSFVLVAIGGVIEMVPTFLVKSNIPTIASVKPYTRWSSRGATSTSPKAAIPAIRR